jgi:hypothetical protein
MDSILFGMNEEYPLRVAFYGDDDGKRATNTRIRKDLEFGLYFLQTLRMSLELTKNPGVIVLGWSGWLGTPSSVGALSASFS